MTSIELTTDPSWVPRSCTLPTVEQPLRLHEFDELFRTGVVDVARTGPASLRLRLSTGPETAAAVASLAVRESRCCGFFTFTLTVAPLDVHLTIDVPTGQTEVLDALHRRVAAART